MWVIILFIHHFSKKCEQNYTLQLFCIDNEKGIPHVLVYMEKKELLCESVHAVFWSIFLKKNSPTSHDHDHQWANLVMAWLLKTKGKGNIKLLDLCKSLIVYILLSTCQWFHMSLAENRPDISCCKKIYCMNGVSWLNAGHYFNIWYISAHIGIQ